MNRLSVALDDPWFRPKQGIPLAHGCDLGEQQTGAQICLYPSRVEVDAHALPQSAEFLQNPQ